MAYTYGYVRVSSADQNAARQIVALRNAGIEDERIFIDNTKRPYGGQTQGKRRLAALSGMETSADGIVEKTRKRSCHD